MSLQEYLAVDAGKSFTIDRHPGYLRLALKSDLNAFHWAEIERSATDILAAIEADRDRLVLVDLVGLDYLGSSQLTLLVRVWKLIKAGHGKMVVLVTAPVVREVLNTAGLETLWEITGSRSEAFTMLNLQADGRPRMSMLWPVVGLIALAGGLTGLCASVLGTGGSDSRVSLIVQLCCSAIALGAGLWTVIRGSGVRRGLGVGMVIASALLAVVEVLQSPR